MRSAKKVPAKKTPRTGFAITMELSAEMVANCLCSAFEGGGSKYWCSIRREVAPRGELAFRSSDKQIIPYIDYPMKRIYLFFKCFTGRLQCTACRIVFTAFFLLTRFYIE